jgi:branched-chain amino acid transport system permease protein
MDTVIVNGFFVGLIYGLLGVGLVLTYRGSRVINFAFGGTGMVGAFAFLDLWTSAHLTLLVALIVAVGIGAGIGGATELFVVRPLRRESRLTVMVATYAVASLLLVFAGRRWGTNPVYFPPLITGSGVTVAGLQILPQQLLILGCGCVMLSILWALYRFTPFGLRLRAIAIDPYAAGLVGVNVGLTSLGTWALAGAVASVTAILIAPLVSFSVFYIDDLLLRGLAAALIGGLTSIWGAFAAGVSIGIVEALIQFKSPVTGISDVIVAAFILTIVLIRPGGVVRSA